MLTKDASDVRVLILDIIGDLEDGVDIGGLSQGWRDGVGEVTAKATEGREGGRRGESCGDEALPVGESPSRASHGYGV